MRPPRPAFYGWVLVWALGLTTVISYGTTQYLFGLLLVPVQRELGWSRAAISGAFSLGFVVYGLAGIPIGALVDRRGARLLMAAGSALAAACLLLLSGVRELWQLYVLWAGGLGLATALTFYPVSFTVVTNWFHRQRGAALGLLTLLGGLASVIFVPLAGWLIAHVGWRQTLVAFASCQLLVALPIHSLLLRRHPEDMGMAPDGAGAAVPPAAEAVPDPSGITLRNALRRGSFWSLTVSWGLALLAGSVVLTHQVAHMISRGFDPVFAAGATGLLGAASLPGRILLNRLSDRLGPRPLLVACGAAQAAGVALLALASSPAWLWGYIAVYGAAFGGVAPLRASVIAEQFGRRAYGSITAVQGFPTAILAAVGPVAAGYMYDRLGSYALPLWLSVAAFAISALAVWLTPRPALPAPPPSRPAPEPAGA